MALHPTPRLRLRRVTTGVGTENQGGGGGGGEATKASDLIHQPTSVQIKSEVSVARIQFPIWTSSPLLRLAT